MNRNLALILAVTGGCILALSLPGPWRAAAEWFSSLGIYQNTVTDQAFSAWAKDHVSTLDWGETEIEYRLNHSLLATSLELGGRFIVNNQKPDGRFNYEYDFMTKTISKDDNQVRQAGALWGLSLIYQYRQTAEVESALHKGLQFFFRHSRPGPNPGSLLIAYPGQEQCKTGTVALVALAIIDYLREDHHPDARPGKPQRDELLHYLEGYLSFLQFMHLDDGHFSRAWSLDSETRSDQSSPYYDGETLLSLIKAAKYLGYRELLPLIDKAAMTMARRYTRDAWKTDVDSDQTKGFFQWGSMAFWEYQDAGWKHSETLGDCVLALAWWMIHTHRTLERNRNTAYAYEGIIHAYRLARSRQLEHATRDLARTIDIGLFRLTSWQVGGPLAAINPFLFSRPMDDPLAIGGVMNHRQEAPLRIDVAQHQMHAVLLALRYVYQEGDRS